MIKWLVPIKLANSLFIMMVICSIMMVISPRHCFAQKKIHSVFFEGTDHELNVYKIYGKDPGKTLMLIGGIQGDEPGGFLSADLYADMTLIKGNLIVVPRANFHSIMLKKRQINEDMNRKFADDRKSNYETKVVSILKKLIAESDCLLNLHDGSGFFSEKFDGPSRNPMKFGQSIIADCETFESKVNGTKIELGEMARQVIAKMNPHIRNPDHYFHFNNHRTRARDSAHKEQRKSATYYALYTCEIPAFGIETSKSLSLEEKVRHHNLAINGFMTELGILPETPGINLLPPKLYYIVLSINDSLPLVVKNNQILRVRNGDFIQISHIEANYERGLTADILGYGAINDLRKKIEITSPTRIAVRKDYYPCGSIDVKIDNTLGNDLDSRHVPGFDRLSQGVMLFKVRINGIEKYYSDHQHVRLIKGDKFEIVDIVSGRQDLDQYVVNFKGFVGESKNNTGEDRGYVIDTAIDLWENYSLQKSGKLYQVVVEKDDHHIAKLFVEINPVRLKYVVCQIDDHIPNCFAPDNTLTINKNQSIKLIDFATNVEDNQGINAYLKGPSTSKIPIRLKEDIRFDKNAANPSDTPNKTSTYEIQICRDDMMIGAIFLKISSGEMM